MSDNAFAFLAPHNLGLDAFQAAENAAVGIGPFDTDRPYTAGTSSDCSASVAGTPSSARQYSWSVWGCCSCYVDVPYIIKYE